MTLEVDDTFVKYIWSTTMLHGDIQLILFTVNFNVLFSRRSSCRLGRKRRIKDLACVIFDKGRALDLN